MKFSKIEYLFFEMQYPLHLIFTLDTTGLCLSVIDRYQKVPILGCFFIQANINQTEAWWKIILVPCHPIGLGIIIVVLCTRNQSGGLSILMYPNYIFIQNPMKLWIQNTPLNKN